MNSDDLVAVTTESPHSVVMVEVNGETYPMRSVRQCRTCQSPYRLEIEQMICSGSSYVAVADALRDRQRGRLPHPTAMALRQHIERQHMPLGKTMQHALIKDRAKEIGRSMEESAASLVDYVAANRTVIQKGMERLTSGEIAPNVAELLTAIRMEHTVQQSATDGLDAAAWQDAMLVYMEVAQQFIPSERLPEYGRALAKNPMLRSIMDRESRTIKGAIANGEETG